MFTLCREWETNISNSFQYLTILLQWTNKIFDIQINLKWSRPDNHPAFKKFEGKMRKFEIFWRKYWNTCFLSSTLLGNKIWSTLTFSITKIAIFLDSTIGVPSSQILQNVVVSNSKQSHIKMKKNLNFCYSFGKNFLILS